MRSKTQSFIGEKERVPLLVPGTTDSDGLHLGENSLAGIWAYSPRILPLPKMRSSYRSGVCFVLRMLRPMPKLVWDNEAHSIEEIEKMPCLPEPVSRVSAFKRGFYSITE